MTRHVPWRLLSLLGLGLVAAGGGFFTVKAIGRSKMRDVMRAAFKRYSLPANWGPALSEKESGSDSAALNMTGADAKRGGAWGATQITMLTARAFGYSGPMERLRTDPEFAAEMTAQMVKTGFAERGGTIYRYGPPASIEAMAAVWNAGRKLDDPNLPSVVVTKYIPALKKALSEVAV